MWEVLAQLCFDPQNEQQIKNKENESSLRWVALSDPPWACLLFLQNKRLVRRIDHEYYCYPAVLVLLVVTLCSIC